MVLTHSIASNGNAREEENAAAALAAMAAKVGGIFGL
jgi:hypothetical protein